MLLSLVLGLIMGAAAVIFALQNVFPVTVTFLAWELTSSLAVLIILSMVMGILISILMTIPGAIRSSFTISKLKKQNKKLSNEVDTVKTTLVGQTSTTEIPRSDI
jgi:lipopolysaccharide assembly protein A